MKKSTSFAQSNDSVTTVRLARLVPSWLMEGQARQLSENTISARRFTTDKLLWFLRQQEFSECGKPELIAFLSYCTTGHQNAGGRWGNPHMVKPVRPRTVQTYFITLQTLFNFLVEEGELSESPMERMKAPISRADQVQPFTREQVNGLLEAAKRTTHPVRDEAIILLLLDTGMRASELCNLEAGQVDTLGRKCTVLGKGNKHRQCCFSSRTARALYKLLRECEEERRPDDRVFLGDRGLSAGEPFGRRGLLLLIKRLGAKAGIQQARCSPHTFRHTFAVEFLRAGGNTFSLQQMLGHTSLTMTNRYVALAQADIENQHRQFSPVERLRGKR